MQGNTHLCWHATIFLKDKGEDHFFVVQMNVSEVKVVEEIEKYVKFGNLVKDKQVVFTS